MREALALVGEEGLDSMWARHQKEHEHLWEGLRELGLEPFVENPEHRLVTVNTVKVLLLALSSNYLAPLWIFELSRASPCSP
jgi:aspartate aminotransferase-like enzyme